MRRVVLCRTFFDCFLENKHMDINIKLTSPLAKIPTHATEGSGCFDLYGTNTDHIRLQEGWPVIIGTGLEVEIPPGYGMFILSRSGHGFKFDTRLANCVGFIDSDYRGEIMIKLTADAISNDRDSLLISPGDRIAQACILPIPRIGFNMVNALSKTERGAGGFGSTGK